jgi:peptide/nickel transport system permease protein
MLFLVVTATFLLEQLIPGDPASFVLGGQATQAQRDNFDASLGLHRSLIDQYGSQLWNVLHGNLGTSWTNGGESVGHLISAALPVTLSLALLTTLVTALVGFALGTLAALRRGRWLDRIAQTMAGVATGLPNFWLALVLVLFLAIDVRVFPATGYTSISSSPVSWVDSLVLPVIALAFGATAGVLLQVRSSMIDVLGQDFIRALAASGLPRRRIICKHALRNGAVPVVTSLGFVFIGLLSGTVVIEQVFNLPGLGSVLLQGVVTHDIPVVQGVVIVFAVVVVFVNVVIDVAAALLNPRIRVG